MTRYLHQSNLQNRSLELIALHSDVEILNKKKN
jgi:hypothetical protein